MTPGAVVVSAHINGLGVIRALAARGIPIAAVSTRPFDIAQHSRWVSESHQLFELHEEPGSLVEFLESRRARWSGWVVFPTTDDALTALSQHHDRLSRWYRLPVQPWELASRIVDKDRMHELAQAVGLGLPTCYGPATGDTAAEVRRYPVLVKPIQHDRLISAFGAKVFLAEDAEGLRLAIDRLSGLGLRGLVFDFVPGPDSNLHVYCVYMDARGKPSAGVTVRKLRQTPPLIGGPRVCETTPELSALREASVELLRHAGFHGMAFVEFKQDSRTGAWVFIEVNGRAVQLGGILPPTGINLVDMAWSEIVHGELPRTRRNGWDGTWVHLLADVRCWWSYRQLERMSLPEFLAPYRRPKTFAVWSASDPGPFLAEAALSVRLPIRTLRRGRRADRQASRIMSSAR
jgi:D-aspartate ligase